MNIVVMNRETVQFKIDIKHIIVSMSDDKIFYPPIPEDNCLGILRLEVFDWDGSHLNSLFCDGVPVPENKVYNTSHAIQVLNFINEHVNDTEIIVCQCDAGISRSSATAAALSLILNGTDALFFRPPYYPNRKIYRTVLNEYVANKEKYGNISAITKWKGGGN